TAGAECSTGFNHQPRRIPAETSNWERGKHDPPAVSIISRDESRLRHPQRSDQKERTRCFNHQPRRIPAETDAMTRSSFGAGGVSIISRDESRLRRPAEPD